MARKRKTLYVKWGSGGLEVELAPQLITVIAKNATLYFEPRDVIIETDYNGTNVFNDSKRTYVYVWFKKEIEPLDAPRIDVVGRYVDELGEIRAVDLGFNKYLTIVTPGDFIYGYAVLTPIALLVQTSGRRKVFFEKAAAFRLILYIV